MASIYKRGRQWWGRVQIDNVDHREPLKTTSETVARRRFREWLSTANEDEWSGKPRRTFDQAMVKFIDEHLPLIKPASRARYQTSIEALLPHFEGVPLDKIRSAKMSEYETARRRAGHRIPDRLKGLKRPKDLSPSTIRRDLACLSAMFGCCMEWEWVEFNPVPAYLRSRKRRGLKESPARTRYLTTEEETKLLSAAKGHVLCPDLHDAICVAIDEGLRSGEEFGLRRSQVSTAKNQIEITEGTKNSKPRDIPLLPRSAQILAHRPAHISSPYLFTNRETGTRYIGLNRALAGAAKRAGIARLTWHDLRRTCGCRLLQDHGMSMEEVSKWLGHSSVQVTEKAYAFLESEHLHRAMKAGTKAAQG